MPALSQRVDDRQDKVQDHAYHEYFEDLLKEIALVLLCLPAVKLFFLVCEESLEWLLHLATDNGNECYQIHGFVHQLFAESDDDDDFLEMHFNHSLADKSRTEESPKWHQEMAACDSSEIKQRVRNLKWEAFSL